MARELSNSEAIAAALSDLAAVAVGDGDYPRAAALHDESISIARATGGAQLAVSLTNRADLALNQADYDRAITLSIESAEKFRALGSREGEAVALFNWASASLRQGKPNDAIAQFTQSLALSHDIGYDQYIAYGLEAVAAILLNSRDPATATRLLAAADHLWQKISASREPVENNLYEHTLAGLQAELDAAAFTDAWEHGQAMTCPQAVRVATDAATRLTRPQAVGAATDAATRASVAE